MLYKTACDEIIRNKIEYLIIKKLQAVLKKKFVLESPNILRYVNSSVLNKFNQSLEKIFFK